MSLFSFDTKGESQRIQWMGINVHREIDQSDSEKFSVTFAVLSLEVRSNGWSKWRTWYLKTEQWSRWRDVFNQKYVKKPRTISENNVSFRFSLEERCADWTSSGCLFWSSVGVQCWMWSEQFSSSCLWTTRRCSRVGISRTIERSRDDCRWNQFKATDRSDDRPRIDPRTSSCSWTWSTNTSISDTDPPGRTFVKCSCLR